MKKILFLIIGVVLLSPSFAMAQNGKNEKTEKKVIMVNKVLPNEQQDSMLIQKLSPEQLMELKKQEMELELQKIDALSKNDMPLKGYQIVLITMLPFLFVITIIGLVANSKNKDSVRRHNLYLKSIELGQTLPEHFFDEPKKQSSSSNLKKGIILIAVGLALVVSYLVMGHKILMIAGIIPAFIGIGFLLVHLLEKPKSTLNNEQQNG
jgi:hypothetical protein